MVFWQKVWLKRLIRRASGPRSQEKEQYTITIDTPVSPNQPQHW
jgi:hypothetical protein